MGTGESTQGAAGGQGCEAVADRIAGGLDKLGGYRRGRLIEMLHQVGAVDRAVYEAIAAVPTPAFDDAMRRLSRAADYSTTWIAIAGGVSLTGPAGRRAAARGLVAIGVASAVVNVGVKSVSGRRRPDRAGAGVPSARHVAMPSSPSFPSGHSASAFAFATAVSRDSPWLAIVMQFLAGSVAYSRVHTGVHYPGDAVAGALLGAGAGQAVSSVFDRVAPRRAAPRRAATGLSMIVTVERRMEWKRLRDQGRRGARATGARVAALAQDGPHGRTDPSQPRLPSTSPTCAAV